MGSVRVVPSPSPLPLSLPGFTGFCGGRFGHRRPHRDNAKKVVQPFANQCVINNEDHTDNGNGNRLGLEGPRDVSECKKGILADGCFI